MRASQVLQKCLSSSLGEMHALRSRVLLRSVEALLGGRRLRDRELVITDAKHATPLLDSSRRT
jgi:hypothetical protein